MVERFGHDEIQDDVIGNLVLGTLFGEPNQIKTNLVLPVVSANSLIQPQITCRTLEVDHLRYPGFAIYLAIHPTILETSDICSCSSGLRRMTLAN